MSAPDEELSDLIRDCMVIAFDAIAGALAAAHPSVTARDAGRNMTEERDTLIAELTARFAELRQETKP